MDFTEIAGIKFHEGRSNAHRASSRPASPSLCGDDITVLEAADSREAMRLIEGHPDLSLILLNLNLPDRDGFSVLSELRMSHPAISVVVMSAEQDHDTVVKALDAGALGFIPKSATREVILGAMQLVISGGVYIPPQVLPGADLGLTERQMVDLLAVPGAVSPADLGLTGLQMDVLTLIMQGKSNKAICRVLDLSEPTVKSHVSAILRALKVNRKRPRGGDLPEAPSPAVPPSPTRAHKGRGRGNRGGFSPPNRIAQRLTSPLMRRECKQNMRIAHNSFMRLFGPCESVG